jgi:hypothetical protein
MAAPDADSWLGLLLVASPCLAFAVIVAGAWWINRQKRRL